MKNCIIFAALVAAFWQAISAAPEDAAQMRMSDETQAVVVVTGFRREGDSAPGPADLLAGEGARVCVRRIDRKPGVPEEKSTQRFADGRGPGRRGFFTADFAVDLDATYEITMTFRDGTVIRVDDYRLPREWRTHFYFHNTRGTLSPASILRIGRAPGSNLICHIYAVFPLENYRRLGGTQLQSLP